MKTFLRQFSLAAMITMIIMSLVGAVPAQASKPAAGIKVPVMYYKLANGLKVVLSPEHSAPLVTVAVYYNIGFRIEPRDRTGFAHLFEHLMFQGSKNLGKMEFIRLVESNGGVLNGSTRFDFTNYFAVMPAHKTETLLWAEADRMRGLDITQDQYAYTASSTTMRQLIPDDAFDGGRDAAHERLDPLERGEVAQADGSVARARLACRTTPTVTPLNG